MLTLLLSITSQSPYPLKWLEDKASWSVKDFCHSSQLSKILSIHLLTMFECGVSKVWWRPNYSFIIIESMFWVSHFWIIVLKYYCVVHFNIANSLIIRSLSLYCCIYDGRQDNTNNYLLCPTESKDSHTFINYNCLT